MRRGFTRDNHHVQAMTPADTANTKLLCGISPAPLGAWYCWHHARFPDGETEVSRSQLTFPPSPSEKRPEPAFKLGLIPDSQLCLPQWPPVSHSLVPSAQGWGFVNHHVNARCWWAACSTTRETDPSGQILSKPALALFPSDPATADYSKLVYCKFWAVPEGSAGVCKESIWASGPRVCPMRQGALCLEQDFSARQDRHLGPDHSLSVGWEGCCPVRCRIF